MREVLCTRKVFVKVFAEHQLDGSVVPALITFADGISYRVDQVLKVEDMHEIDKNKKGIRYTIEIAGKTAYLFDDLDGKWSVKQKVYKGESVV